MEQVKPRSFFDTTSNNNILTIKVDGQNKENKQEQSYMSFRPEEIKEDEEVFKAQQIWTHSISQKGY